MAAADTSPGRLGPDESAFLAERDSFYLATVGSTGWPYVQHRGGPKGFLKVIDDQTIAFADFRGNKQFISTGNLSYIKYGVLTARRGWLTKADVLNTLPPEQFLAALRPKPGMAKAKPAGGKSAKPAANARPAGKAKAARRPAPRGRKR